MSTSSRGSLAAAAAGPGKTPEPLRAGLSALYQLSQNSRYVFASPLGPFADGDRNAHLPRFVFFGPNASDESWRLALLAGLDRRDVRSSLALVALASRLAADSETGHALNLSFFPLVDVAGPEGRGLASAHWHRSRAPEIACLEQDARMRAYHGFVRVETDPTGDDLIGIRVRGAFAGVLSPDLELITSEETSSFPVRFESELPGAEHADGPLSIADDLPFEPFELTLRIPGSWSEAAYQHAAVTLLERFLTRYRAFQAYGQHL
jgi:hypothetical protein